MQAKIFGRARSLQVFDAPLKIDLLLKAEFLNIRTNNFRILMPRLNQKSQGLLWQSWYHIWQYRIFRYKTDP